MELYLFVFGFIISIFISSFFHIGISFALFLIFISIIIFLYRKYIVEDLAEKQKIFYIGLFLLSIGLGILRYEIRDTRNIDTYVESYVGHSAAFEGMISDEPQKKETATTLIVQLKNNIVGSSTIPVSGKILVSTDLYPEFEYGDTVKISGTLKRPENFSVASSSNTENLNVKDFDYISYLAKDDIFYKIDFAKVTLVSSGNGNSVKTYLFKIKNAFLKNINRVMPEPESSLLAGILIGAKTSLDTDTTNTFRIAGLSHIIALSGYNITIVAKAVMSVLSFLPRVVGSSFGILSIILFVLMSGGTSTAVRAGIMSVIALVGTITGRKYNIGRALFVAGFLMVCINPKILVYDISFQLSFLATLSIVYVSPIIKKYCTHVTEKFGLQDMIATTIAAQVLVLPLILYKMGLLSLVALPANIFVFAIVPLTMLLGFITGAVGFFSSILSLPFAWMSYMCTWYIIAVAKFFAAIPFSYITIDWFSVWMMALSYIGIGIWIIRENQK